jgi:hypothetical protein
MRLALAALGLMLATGLPAAGVRPVVSVLGTCSALTSNTYPADPVSWFDATRHSQVVFYAHLLFPLRPEGAELEALPASPWHPPLKVGASAAPVGETVDEFVAEAEWLDPKGDRVAFYSLTFPARIKSDLVRVSGRDYIPHTFAMAIGTRDLRSEAGQTRLPAMEGQYAVKLKVDGRPVGLGFFRMLKSGASQPLPATTTPQAVQAK